MHLLSSKICLCFLSGILFDSCFFAKAWFLKLDCLIYQEEETQVTGVIMMMDLKGVGFSHAKNISPFYAKRIMGLLQVLGVATLLWRKGLCVPSPSNLYASGFPKYLRQFVYNLWHETICFLDMKFCGFLKKTEF